jgi:hypothetical protein
MTFDEKIDKITERHEALAQSVELMQRDTAEFRVIIRNMAHAVDGLVQMARSHEERLDRMEGR